MGERFIALVALTALAACGSPAAHATGSSCDNTALTAARAERHGGAEVCAAGTVVRVGEPRPGPSGRHEEFFLALGDGHVVRVDANLDVLRDLPVKKGEAAVVQGEYYVDGRRDGIHWVHHTAKGSHPSGYVELDGKRYE